MSAIITGIALIALGPIFYFLADSGGGSPTAFIPSFFGIVILICGVVAQKESARKIAMHAAVLFGILGAVGGLMRGIGKWPALFDGSLTDGRLPAIATLLMFVICAVFVASSIGQFMRMRRA